MRPPVKIDVSQRSILGVTYRQIGILILAGGLALAAFVGLAGAPLFLRGALAVLCAGLGLAWAFGLIESQTPEAWLLDVITFRRRSRFMLHRAMRGAADRRRAAWPEDSPAAGGPSRLEPFPEEAAAAAGPGFFYLSANAIGASILAGLTLWLIQGGAHQLTLMWQRF